MANCSAIQKSFFPNMQVTPYPPLHQEETELIIDVQYEILEEFPLTPRDGETLSVYDEKGYPKYHQKKGQFIDVHK